jgi:hypothetical protein
VPEKRQHIMVGEHGRANKFTSGTRSKKRRSQVLTIPFNVQFFSLEHFIFYAAVILFSFTSVPFYYIEKQ